MSSSLSVQVFEATYYTFHHHTFSQKTSITGHRPPSSLSSTNGIPCLQQVGEHLKGGHPIDYFQALTNIHKNIHTTSCIGARFQCSGDIVHLLQQIKTNKIKM